jgi:hypothetical protein
MNYNLLNDISKGVVYTFPVITLYGLIANALAFVIFSRKKFHQTSFSTYYRCLIINDTFSLLLPINKFLESNLSINFFYISDLTCKLRVYYAYFMPPMSAWITVLIGVDRMLSILSK